MVGVKSSTHSTIIFLCKYDVKIRSFFPTHQKNKTEPIYLCHGADIVPHSGQCSLPNNPLEHLMETVSVIGQHHKKTSDFEIHKECQESKTHLIHELAKHCKNPDFALSQTGSKFDCLHGGCFHEHHQPCDCHAALDIHTFEVDGAKLESCLAKIPTRNCFSPCLHCAPPPALFQRMDRKFLGNVVRRQRKKGSHAGAVYVDQGSITHAYMIYLCIHDFVITVERWKIPIGSQKKPMKSV